MGWFYADKRAIRNQPVPLPDFSADSIWYYLKKNEAVSQQANNPLELAMIERHIGVYLDADKPAEALRYYEAAIRIYAHQPAYQANLAMLLLSVADIHLRLGHVRQAGLALAQARKIRAANHFAMSTVWEQLDRVEMNYSRATGRWKSAFTHSQVLRRAEAQRYETDRAGAISRLNIEYETEKKEALLKSQQRELTLNAEKQQVQTRFLVAVLVFLAASVVVGLVLYRLYRQNRRISQRNAELVRNKTTGSKTTSRCCRVCSVCRPTASPTRWPGKPLTRVSFGSRRWPCCNGNSTMAIN